MEPETNRLSRGRKRCKWVRDAAWDHPDMVHDSLVRPFHSLGNIVLWSPVQRKRCQFGRWCKLYWSLPLTRPRIYLTICLELSPSSISPHSTFHLNEVTFQVVGFPIRGEFFWFDVSCGQPTTFDMKIPLRQWLSATRFCNFCWVLSPIHLYLWQRLKNQLAGDSINFDAAVWPLEVWPGTLVWLALLCTSYVSARVIHKEILRPPVP